MRYHGTVKLTKKGTWLVRAEPHVMMRLKRVFGRFRGKTPKTMTLRNTLEVCRDLAWFCERFPLEIEQADYLARRSEDHREQAEHIAALFAGEIEPRPFELAIPARDYQRIAAEAILRRGSLLLADDVGLGKTVSAIAALTDPTTRPALVVTLAHLPKQWQRELSRFAPNLRSHIINKGTPYALDGRRDGQGQLFRGEEPDVLITTYHKLAGWEETLAGKVKTVIFDEVQELRSGLAQKVPQKYKAATAICAEAPYRMGLTATPIYNYGGEFFSVLAVLEPGTLGTRSEFFGEWCQGWGGAKARIKETAAFGTYLRAQGTMLRRTRKDVGRELPGITMALHHVEADEKELGKVERNAAELAKVILQAGGGGFDKMKASEELSYLLRQATGIAKAPYVASFVRLLVESGERVVLYGWHREVYRHRVL